VAIQTSRDLDVAPGAEGVRRVIKRVALRSVLKFSLLMAATVGLIIMLAGGVLYFIASVTGVVGQIESFIHRVGYTQFRVQSSTVFGFLLLFTVLGAVAWVAIATIATAIFNLVAEASGGIEVTFRE
jgi:hypothetical protein